MGSHRRHCLLDTDAVVVGYGNNDRTKTNKIESEKIIVHPGYIAGEKADLALVKLKTADPRCGGDQLRRCRQGARP